VMSNGPAQQVAQAALMAQVPAGQNLVPESETFVRENDTQTAADGRVRFKVDAAGVSVPVVDPQQVRELVKGQSVDDSAVSLAADLPLSMPPVIAVEPAWYPWLPWMPFRIRVVVTPGT